MNCLCRLFAAIVCVISTTLAVAALRPADFTTSGPVTHLIIAGQGIDGYKLGDDARVLTGRYAFEPDLGGFLLAREEGLVLSVKEGKISGFLCLFRSLEADKTRPVAAFRGKTDRDIGAASKEEDVIAAYGQPTEIKRSVLPASSAVQSGSTQVIMNYDELRMSLIFFGGNLTVLSIGGD